MGQIGGSIRIEVGTMALLDKGSNRYPKYQLPSNVDELMALEPVFGALDLQGQYNTEIAESGADKRELEMLFDKNFALVENTTSFFWLFHVLERKGKEDEKHNERHKQMILHLLRG